MDGVLRVAIVGGSDTARQLVTDFLSRPFIDVACLVASDEDSPGARAATRASIPVATSPSALTDLAPQPDLVIAVGSEPGIAEELATIFPAGSDGPTVVHDVVAQLVLNLVADSRGGTTSPEAILPPSLQKVYWPG